MCEITYEQPRMQSEESKPEVCWQPCCVVGVLLTFYRLIRRERYRQSEGKPEREQQQSTNYYTAPCCCGSIISATTHSKSVLDSLLLCASHNEVTHPAAPCCSHTQHCLSSVLLLRYCDLNAEGTSTKYRFHYKVFSYLSILDYLDE